MAYNRRIIESRQNHNASKNIVAKARILRKRMTNAEKTLWTYLRREQQNGFHFRKQHPFSIYILDFYCFKANLAIEVDGPVHQYRIEYYAERTRFLESAGLRVLRIKNEDVEYRIECVLELINKVLTEDSES